jgi:hypothetical protein
MPNPQARADITRAELETATRVVEHCDVLFARVEQGISHAFRAAASGNARRALSDARDALAALRSALQPTIERVAEQARAELAERRA